MTLNEVLTNEELRRSEFPVANTKAFFAHAGVCPLPQRVAEAVAQCASQGTHGDQEAFMLSRLDGSGDLLGDIVSIRSLSRLMLCCW